MKAHVLNQGQNSYNGFSHHDNHSYITAGPVFYCWGMQWEDTLWLDIFNQEASCIVRQTYRLRNLIRSLRDPYSQTPSLALFFESPEWKYFPEDEESGVHLRLDPDTAKGRHPLLIANTKSILSHSPPRCASTRGTLSASVIQEKVFPRAESLSVLPRILLPFADVLYFMCMNQSDMRVIEAQINQWMLAWREAGTGTPLPGIVVLLSEFYPLQPVTVQRQLAKRLPTGKICVVRIEQSTWSTDGFGPIRERLGQTAVRTRRWKINHSMLFSARHMMGLFEESFRTTTAKRPFRYVKASRSLHPVAPDLFKHLNNYVETLSESYGQSFAAESIAASFLLDHLTPGMHGSSAVPVLHVNFRTCRKSNHRLTIDTSFTRIQYTRCLHRLIPGHMSATL